MSKMKLVGVKVKRTTTKKDNVEGWPEMDAMSAFEKKYKAANKEFGDGHWSVTFVPENLRARIMKVNIGGPYNFPQPAGPRGVQDSKKRLKDFQGLLKEFEQAIDYAEKKHKELEKEFKSLPAEVRK